MSHKVYTYPIEVRSAVLCGRIIGLLSLALAVTLGFCIPARAQTVLYDQDFETLNVPFQQYFHYADLSLVNRTVQDYFDNQPAGIVFADNGFTVETVNITGGNAYPAGYVDDNGTVYSGTCLLYTSPSPRDA